MIADLKPYPEYKESGLPWLGQVPAHWEVSALSRSSRALISDRRTGNEELLTRVTRDAASSHAGLRRVTMFKAESYLSRLQALLAGRLGHQQHAGVAGGLGVSRHHGIISSGLRRLSHLGRRADDFVRFFTSSSDRHRSTGSFEVRSKGIWISRLQLTRPILSRCSDATSPARRAGGDCAVSGLGERAAGAGDPGEAEGDRAAQRAEAGHHPPRRHPRPRPLRPPQTLRHPLARRHSAALGGATLEARLLARSMKHLAASRDDEILARRCVAVQSFVARSRDAARSNDVQIASAVYRRLTRLCKRGDLVLTGEARSVGACALAGD